MKRAISCVSRVCVYASMLFLLACAPAATPLSPGMLETLVAATVQALPSPTAQPTATFTSVPTAQRPTATSWPTETTLPTIPPLPSLTPLPTDTPLPTATLAGYNLGVRQGDANFACIVTAQNPSDSFVASSGQDIAVTWRIRNVGKRDWEKENIDVGYVSGQKMAIGGTRFDLANTIPAGQAGDIVITFEAPDKAGTYRTIWTLLRGSTPFCEFGFGLVVK